MDEQKASMSRSSESQPKKRKAIVKDSMDLWLESLGVNIPPEKLKSMQEQVKSNPKLAYYLQFLKSHSRPRAEAKQMKKFYLYKAIKEGDLKNNLPENVTVTGSRDVELLRKYTTSVYKTEALESVKIPEAVKELVKYNEIFTKKNRQLHQSTDSFIRNTGHLQKLNSAHNNITKINTDLLNIIKCVKVFMKPEIGSDNFRRFLLFDEDYVRNIERILNISCSHIDRGNRKEFHRLIILCYKKILNSELLKNLVNCNPSRYLASITSCLVQSGSENSQTTPLNLEEIMDNIEKFKKLFITFNSIRITIPQYFKNYEKYSSRNSELLLKVNSLNESVKTLYEIRNNFNKISEVNTTFLTPHQFATIKQIFNKWGEEVESSENILNDCIIRKQQEYETYQILIQLMSDISRIQFSIDFKYDNLNALMNNSLVKFTEYSDKIPDLIHTNKHMGIKILKLIMSMSYFKINNVPITEIIQDIKRTIVDDTLVRHMPIE